MEIAILTGLLALGGIPVWSILAIRGVRRARTGTAQGAAPTAMAELSVLAALVAILRGGGLLALFALALPPLVLVAIPSPMAFAGIARPALMVAVPLALFAALLYHRVAPRRVGLILIPGLLAMIAGGIVAERVSLRAMCETARAAGLTGVARNSLLWSLANTPRDFQIELHAMARGDGADFGRSYAEMGWYSIPPSVSANISSGAPACGF